MSQRVDQAPSWSCRYAATLLLLLSLFIPAAALAQEWEVDAAPPTDCILDLNSGALHARLSVYEDGAAFAWSIDGVDLNPSTDETLKVAFVSGSEVLAPFTSDLTLTERIGGKPHASWDVYDWDFIEVFLDDLASADAIRLSLDDRSVGSFPFSNGEAAYEDMWACLENESAPAPTPAAFESPAVSTVSNSASSQPAASEQGEYVSRPTVSTGDPNYDPTPPREFPPSAGDEWPEFYELVARYSEYLTVEPNGQNFWQRALWTQGCRTTIRLVGIADDKVRTLEIDWSRVTGIERAVPPSTFRSVTIRGGMTRSDNRPQPQLTFHPGEKQSELAALVSDKMGRCAA